jgi:hypothetical protein
MAEPLTLSAFFLSIFGLRLSIIGYLSTQISVIVRYSSPVSRSLEGASPTGKRTACLCDKSIFRRSEKLPPGVFIRRKNYYQLSMPVDSARSFLLNGEHLPLQRIWTGVPGRAPN